MGLFVRRLTALLAMMATAGCGLVLGYGDPVELDVRDGGLVVPDVTSPSDVSSRDTAAATDAGQVADARVEPAYCDALSPKPTFCASFDGPSFLGEWGSSFSVGTVLARNTAAFESAPASMRVAYVPTADVKSEGTASIELAAIQGKPFRAKLAFSMRVEAAAPEAAYATVANVAMLVGGFPTFAVQVLCRPLGDGTSISVGVTELQPRTFGSALAHGPTQNVIIGSWVRIELELVVETTDGGTAGNRMKLVVGGKPGYDGPITLPVGSGAPLLTLGILGVEQPRATA